jgi:hypothetical protein
VELYSGKKFLILIKMNLFPSQKVILKIRVTRYSMKNLGNSQPGSKLK